MSKKQSNARLMAKDLISGCFGGIGIVAVGHPFDTLKVNILLLSIYKCSEFILTITIANPEYGEPHLQEYDRLHQEDH